MAKPNKKKPQGQKINYKKQQRQEDKQEQQQETRQLAVQDCADGELTLQLQAYDTWFFRESRPHDAVGASKLSSLFPPPVRTLAGALRTFLGDQVDIDWQTLQCKDNDFDFQHNLGNAEHLGQLQLNGPWICYKDQRLYPAPLYLMQQEQIIERLGAGKPVRCDLGTVRLPVLPEGCRPGFKNLEQRWLNAVDMAKCLNGEVPEAQKIISADDLFSHEARLGIARDNSQRKVLDGKLYQTRHLRLKDEVQVELKAKNLHPLLIKALPVGGQAIVRLGGEGRMASLETSLATEPLPFAKAKAKQSETLLLHFITPADFNGQMFPENFTKTEYQGKTVWQGVLNGIELMIEAAVIGKAHREGGWDMQKHQPRPVRSHIPAGSAWYCRLAQSYDWQTLQTQLHGQCIGLDSAYGRGQILLGHWHDTHNG
jgi:CRISPR-associated protein Cmr3